jgi:hypothetical protein
VFAVAEAVRESLGEHVHANGEVVLIVFLVVEFFVLFDELYLFKDLQFVLLLLAAVLSSTRLAIGRHPILVLFEIFVVEGGE